MKKLNLLLTHEYKRDTSVAGQIMRSHLKFLEKTEKAAGQLKMDVWKVEIIKKKPGKLFFFSQTTKMETDGGWGDNRRVCGFSLNIWITNKCRITI